MSWLLRPADLDIHRFQNRVCLGQHGKEQKVKGNFLMKYYTVLSHFITTCIFVYLKRSYLNITKVSNCN